MKKSYKYLIGIILIIVLISLIMIPLILYSGIDTESLNTIGAFTGVLIGNLGGCVVIVWAEN